MDLREVGYDDRDWIKQDRDRWRAYEGGNEPSGSLKPFATRQFKFKYDAGMLKTCRTYYNVGMPLAGRVHVSYLAGRGDHADHVDVAEAGVSLTGTLSRRESARESDLATEEANGKSPIVVRCPLMWLMPQLHEDKPGFLFQQDGALPHFQLEVREYLNEHLPQRWCGRASNNDRCVLRWPPRSPDLTPCDFFSVGVCQRSSVCTSLPVNLEELNNRIRAAVARVDRDMLQRVWQELDYRVDVCRVTRGGHIEHL
ncbi:hypothetical protein ANN_21064 [Periplaneta americana]|uniref:Uncharacterized protein n=1 Tax=Periplaneta americana TaxID=6978 RepID=A0ABQ8SEG2_PERAM|nr:hypothetical protein ANN_21064 [Periplaneta americana]